MNNQCHDDIDKINHINNILFFFQEKIANIDNEGLQQSINELAQNMEIINNKINNILSNENVEEYIDHEKKYKQIMNVVGPLLISNSFF